MRTADSARTPLAKLGIGIVALLTAALLFAVAGRYGFLGDELYFLAAGRRLAVSYADQGPLVPLLARLMDLLRHGSVVALRLPSALLSAGMVVLAGLLAREFRASRGAQVLAAVATATSLFLLPQGHLLATATVDSALWVLITWFVVRWVQTGADRWLLFAALATAVDLQVKWLIPVFWLCLGIAVLVFGPRRMLSRPMLWLGAGIVVLSMLPSLLWQAGRGWPQLRLAGMIAEDEAAARGWLLFTPEALKLAGWLGIVLLGYGVWRLFRAEELRAYRFLALTGILLFAAFIALGGRPYYAVGVFPVLIAAGAAELGRRRLHLLGRGTIAVLAAVSAWSAVTLLPWQPASAVAPVRGPADAEAKQTINGQLGWRAMVSSTAESYRKLPPAERAGSVVLTDSYARAGAFDEFGPSFGLPKVYSPGRGFGYFGPPRENVDTVVYVGGTEEALRATFTEVRQIGASRARLGMPGETKDVPIWRCAGKRESWARMWPRMMTM